MISLKMGEQPEQKNYDTLALCHVVHNIPALPVWSTAYPYFILDGLMLFITAKAFKGIKSHLSALDS